MAKIMKFKKPVKLPEGKPKQVSSNTLVDSLSRIFDGLEASGVDLGISIVILRIESHIRGLRGIVDPKDVAIRKAGLKGATTEDIENRLRNSGVHQWNGHPSYYLAMVQEIEERLNS